MNNYNPASHHRRSIRLKGYDYSQAGLYFITICCQDRACLFGEIKEGELMLNDAGKMVEAQWLALTTRFTHIDLHEYIVMPNHFHGILQILDASSEKTVGDMMDAFKSITTVEYIRGVKTLGWQPFAGRVWQRNYYEHIIRNERAYQTISSYISNNPSKWDNDKFYH